MEVQPDIFIYTDETGELQVGVPEDTKSLPEVIVMLEYAAKKVELLQIRRAIEHAQQQQGRAKLLLPS